MAFGIDDGVIILVVAALIFFFGRNQVKAWAKDLGGAVKEFNDGKKGVEAEVKDAKRVASA